MSMIWHYSCEIGCDMMCVNEDSASRLLQNQMVAVFVLAVTVQ